MKNKRLFLNGRTESKPWGNIKGNQEDKCWSLKNSLP